MSEENDLLAKMPLIKLVKMALLGSVLVALTGLFTVVYHISDDIHPRGSPMLLAYSWSAHSRIIAAIAIAAVYFLPAVAGGVLVITAKLKIRAGIKKGAWSEGEIASAYGWIQSPAVKQTENYLGAAAILIMLGWFVYGTAAFFITRRGHDICVVLILLQVPLQTMAFLRTQLEPRVDVARERVPWATKRLHSEHWGRPAEGMADGEPG